MLCYYNFEAFFLDKHNFEINLTKYQVQFCLLAILLLIASEENYLKKYEVSTILVSGY